MKKKKDSHVYRNTYTNEPLTTYTPSAFENIREQFHLKPIEKETRISEHVCTICGKPKERIEGTNIIVCTNPDCKGYKPRNAKEDDPALPSFSKIGSFKNN